MNLVQRNIDNFKNPLVESNRALDARMNSEKNENSINSIGNSVVGLDYPVKSDNYDGTKHFREFVANANYWNESAKTMALALYLRGGRDLFWRQCDFNIQKNHMEFSNRKLGENLATLAADLNKLSRFVYQKYTANTQNTIACTQFINAVRNPLLPQTLQLERVKSLKKTVMRAIEIEQ
ncbi:hypothetical protein V1477_019439 [Vespula maculifrons]|uniref:Uncharacterized protein n=1 Tax=Vespula maculifrons TaxID=7453 RepID=A0ABD2ASJ8_VESMC